ncbi:MAG: DUF58 domain-containing protein [Sandaracinaceae bacterium]|jgi:uncharacterized protein (DUF58 family)|nr:DUF58 domain-containing protein [Sandaracinaceae bacterium]
MSERAAMRDLRVVGKGSSSWARPRLRTTREGKVFIVVTLGVGVAAVNTGNNLLYLMLGFMLSLIILSGVMSEIALRHIKIERRLPTRAFAGTTMLVEIALTNSKKTRASYSLEVEDLVSNVPSERRCYFLKVGPDSEQVTAYRRVHSRRGTLTFTGFRLATRYPFGLFEKWRIVPGAGEFVVFPALAASPASLPLPDQAGIDGRSRRIGRGTEIAGLRDHRSEDEMRNVHWGRTASLGRMVVREREREDVRHVTLLVDNARPSNADEKWAKAFERTISQAATLAEQALAEGASVEIASRASRSPLVAGGKRPDPLWHFLALLSAIDGADAKPFDVATGAREVVLVAA